MRSSSIFPTNTFTAFRLTTAPNSGAIMYSNAQGFGFWTSGILASPEGKLIFPSGAGFQGAVIASSGFDYNNGTILFPQARANTAGATTVNLLLQNGSASRKLDMGVMSIGGGSVSVSGLCGAGENFNIYSAGSMNLSSAGTTKEFKFGPAGSTNWTIDLTSNNVFTTSPNRTSTFSSYIAPGIGAAFTFRQNRPDSDNDLLNLTQTGSKKLIVTSLGDLKISGTGFFPMNLVLSSGAVSGYVYTCLDSSGRGLWQPPSGGGGSSVSGALTSGAANTLSALLTLNGGVASSVVTATVSPYIVTSTDYIIEAAFATGTTGTVVFRSGFFVGGQQFIVKDSLGRATNGGIILSGSGILIDGTGTFLMDQDFQSASLFRNSSGNMNMI